MSDDWDELGSFGPHRRMKPIGVRTVHGEADSGPHIALLKEQDGARFLAIALEPLDAAAIAGILQNVEIPASEPYRFMLNVFRTLAVEVEQAVLDTDTNVPDGAVVTVNGIELRTRPAEAIIMAYGCEAPLLATNELLEVSGLTAQ